ncbi:MAG: hemolysin family protein [Planctomycetota bacterium]|nr:hemolysin family protein [Planctomycetota bacterium]
MIVMAIIACLVGATYLSALTLSLRQLSKPELRRRLEARKQEAKGVRLLERLDATIYFTSLLCICFRLGVFIFVLLELIGLGENTKLELNPLLISCAISVGLVWLFSTVISSAIAKYAGTGTVVRSMWLLLVFGALGTPMTALVGFIDEAVKRLAGANLDDRREPEEEILRSIEEQQFEGSIDEDAATLLENVVEFRTTDVAEVMTPRTDIEGIERTDDLTTIREFIIEAGHSRIPVYEENLDKILGILYVKDLIPFLGTDGADFELNELLRQPFVMPMTKVVSELLSDFQRSEVHLAIVIDEYGGTAGLVTIEDVLEEIVGEIHDEHEPDDEEEPTLKAIDATHAEVDGRYHIDDLNDALGLKLPEDADYDTVAGFVLAQLGRVPKKGDSFEAKGARFIALEASPTTVQRIAVELLEPVEAVGEAKNGNEG